MNSVIETYSRLAIEYGDTENLDSCWGSVARDSFIGRDNGREFIRKTTPVFFTYLTPAMMVEAASLRKPLTVEEASALFGKVRRICGDLPQRNFEYYAVLFLPVATDVGSPGNGRRQGSVAAAAIPKLKTAAG